MTTMMASQVNVPRPDGAEGVLRVAPAAGSVEIGLAGFATPASFRPHDDDQALSHALYAYPTAHAAFWRTVRAQARVAAADDPIPPGSFDEHLALDGVQESQLWVGDLLRFPGCTLVVGVPRLPDERFNATLGFPHAAKMVAQSRWCGFWLAVRTPGRIAAGDPFELIPGPRATGVVELFRARTKGWAG
jgi:MOSC domain-containing protein YiiM